MAPPRLDQLPSELIDAIASFLRRRDFLIIRFVCHALRNGSESLFRRTYFTSRITSLDLDDLHSLLEISRHPKFSGDIKTLKIDVRLLARPSSVLCPLDLCEPLIGGTSNKEMLRNPQDQPLQEYRNALREISEAQELGDRVGLQTAVLTSILRNLPALASIHLGSCRSRFFKMVEEGWVSAGVLPLRSNRYSSMLRMFDDGLGIDKVLAVMSVSMRPLTTLTISNFNPGSSTIPKHLPTALSYCLNSVKILSLHFRREYIQQGWEARLLDYLTTMPNVQDLTLMADERSEQLAMDQICTAILWPNLTRCVLSWFTCAAEGFHNFIRKHEDTLREIELYGGSLRQGNWRPTLYSILNAAKARSLSIHCPPFSRDDPEHQIAFEAEGTPAEVSATLSRFLERLPQAY